VLEILETWAKEEDTDEGLFTAADVAGRLSRNTAMHRPDDVLTVREFLFPGVDASYVFSAKSLGRKLKRHLDEPVKKGRRTLVLRRWMDPHTEVFKYYVASYKHDA
jgi:hypothetical protein